MKTTSNLSSCPQPGITYPGITTAIFCHDGAGRFLLNQRTDRCRDEIGCWDAWGGRVEHGETLESAARREFAEECGANILSLQFAGINEAFRTDPQGRPTHWLVAIYLAQIDPSTAKNNEPSKFSQIGWFEPNHWPTPLHSMFLQDFAIAAKLYHPPTASRS